MKKIYLLSFVLLISAKVFATHNISGEISFNHVTGLNYEVDITTYTKASSVVDHPILILFYGDGTTDSLPRINGGGNGVIVAPGVRQNIYSGAHLYPGTGTYIIHFEDLNRDGGIVNIPNSINTALYTEAQLVINSAGSYNSSARFLQIPIINVIDNSPLTHNVTAYDPDGDCLTFELVSCKGAFGQPIPGYWLPNFVSIDSINGEMTWTSPAMTGLYSFAVKVNESRNGVLIGYVIRDFQITVLPPPAFQFYFSGNNAWQTDINGNYSYTLNAGSTLNLNLSYTDSFVSPIDLNAYGEAFALTNPPVFSKTISIASISSMFSWNVTAANVRSAPYIVTFRGASDNINNDLSLLIYVVDANTVPCSYTTSINETNQFAEGIKIFPNPSPGIFSITGLERGSINHLLIYDLTGRLVKNITLENRHNIIDASDISDGFFIFELRDEKSVLMNGKLILK
ncbi:MAG: T9SS type A sorting domain-containing protein [Bacteroidia bacterium]